MEGLLNIQMILTGSIVDKLEALHTANLQEQVVAELLLGYPGNQTGRLPFYIALTLMQLAY